MFDQPLSFKIKVNILYNAPIKEIKFLLKDLFQIEKLFKDTKYESLDEDNFTN